MQVVIKDHTFRLPYWDWTQESQREFPFTKERLGETMDNTVDGGELFDNWDTICWKNPKSDSFRNICNPMIPTGSLRRCPNAADCMKDNPNWPSEEDVDEAVSITSYDASPYNRSVKDRTTSFRNFMEGFIFQKDGCKPNDSMCDTNEGESITRKLHNSVSHLFNIYHAKFALESPGTYYLRDW